MEAAVPHNPGPGSGPVGAARAPGGAFLGVLACFVLSGFAALLYQTAWLRQFSIVFGTSELAVAAVLAAYMAGLALGAAVAGRLVDRVRRPVLVYGLLELGIALGALAVPLGLRLARGLQTALIGGQDQLVAPGGPGQPLFYLACAFAVVMVPTTFMGATLPLLTRHAVRRQQDIGPRVGLLYAMNTAGAVAGTLVAAFVLLPALGLHGTVLVGVAVNAVVFVLAATIARRAPALGEDAAPDPERPAEEAGSSSWGPPIPYARARWILPLILVSGITSFTYEVLWTRLISHVVGGSVYAFAIMLASFLAGITLGSAVAAGLARNRRGSALGFVVSQLGIALLSMWVYTQMDGLPERFTSTSWGGTLDRRTGAAISALLLLPSTLCIGATFPFALRVLARGKADAGPASARVYAWNTTGAIVGALLAGFVLVPLLGFEGAVRLAVATNLALAAAAAILLLSPHRALVAATALGALAVMITFRPQAPERLLCHSQFSAAAAAPAGPAGPAGGGSGAGPPPEVQKPKVELLFSAVGRSATVTLIEYDDRIYEVRSNGLPEAEITPAGAPPFGRNPERFLTLLPILARPAAETMMVVGFGGGVALETVPPSVREVDVIELEPEVLEANRFVADRRQIDPFADPRLNVVVNDARGAMALTDERWDVIVSQPSHPWTAGASHLYTREFSTLCREHLTDDGVFVMWISLALLDEPLLRSLTATLLETFEHLRLYRPVNEMLVFLASQAPLEVERDIQKSGQPMAAHPDYYLQSAVTCVEDVAAMLASDRAGLVSLARGASTITDDRNQFAMRPGPELERPLNANLLVDLLFPEDLGRNRDPIVDPASALSRALDLDRVYLARRMIYTVPNRAARLLNRMPDGPEHDLAKGLVFSTYATGQWAQGGQAILNAFSAAPDDPRVIFAMVRNVLSGVQKGQQATRLTGVPAAVYRGWQLAASGSWQELAELEPILAQATPTDLWYADAAHLRATWRIGRAQAEVRRPDAREALVILDQSLVYDPHPNGLLLRLEAARVADLPLHMLETLDQLIEIAGPRAAVLPPAQRRQILEGLRAWAPGLEALGQDQRVPPDRLQALSSRLADLLAQETTRQREAQPDQVFR